MVLTLTPEERLQFDNAMRSLELVPEVRQLRDPEEPDWWFGDDEAYQSSMSAALMVGNG